MKSPKERNRHLSVLVSLVIGLSAHAGDPPIDRDFLQTSEGTWLYLKKIDWEKTEFLYGKGKGNEKRKDIIWSKIYESTDERSWAYAYFLQLKPGHFVYDLDGDGNKEVAVATYEMGNNMIRQILIFSIRKEQVIFVREHGPYNIAADEPIF